MTARLSLRARIFLGAVLWSIGLFLAAGFALTHYMLIAPEAPKIFHGLFVRHMFLVLAVTILCLVVGLVQVRRGLASFNTLRPSIRNCTLAGSIPLPVPSSKTAVMFGRSVAILAP